MKHITYLKAFVILTVCPCLYVCLPNCAKNNYISKAR